MEENIFIKLLKENSYSDYEILLLFFIKNLKFLQNPKYGSYYLSHYSWFSHEIQVKFSSSTKNIEIRFVCDMGSKLEVYLVEKSFFSTKNFYLNDLINSEVLNDNLTINNADDIIRVVSNYLENSLLKVLVGKEQIDKIKKI